MQPRGSILGRDRKGHGMSHSTRDSRRDPASVSCFGGENTGSHSEVRFVCD